MKEREGSPIGLYMLGICALFLAGFLLLVILGANAYKGSVASREENHQIRGLLSYVSAVIRANDSEGSVYVLDQASPQGGQVLVVGDGSGYASRVDCHDGYLVEDYGEEKGTLDPQNALKIGRTLTFRVDVFPEEGSILVTTDEGRIRLHLRSKDAVADSAAGGAS